jgi:ribose 5-phosphate isomerase B
VKVAIGCDHTGVAMKRALLESVLSDHLILDVGTDSEKPVDYPDFAKKVAAAVTSGEAEKGILICGTGIGMAMAAGKVPGIRAASCSEPYSAELSRRHNDANILCLGARVIGTGMAKKVTETWLTCPFDGGRHTPRVEKIG